MVTGAWNTMRRARCFTGVGLDIGDYTGGIMKKEGSAMTMLDSKSREDIRSRNMIDVLHKALQLWHDQRGDEMRELLVTTGNANNPKFNAVCQAIIEAGAAKPGAHGETAERREIAAFSTGRRLEAVATPPSKTIDSFM